jgi:molecular chaperone DnaK (HSP70)
MVLEAKQFADKDWKAREIAELRNRIKAIESAVSRSFSDLGWLLDGADQAMIKEALQKMKSLPTENVEADLLRNLLTNLEDGAGKLSAAMYSVPGMEGLRPVQEIEEQSSSNVDRLLKSALDDMKKKS